MLPALAMLGAALITVFATFQMRATEESEAFAGFSQNSRRLAQDVDLRLASMIQLASSGAGLLSAGKALNREGWAAYIAGLQTIGHGSGFQGLGVAFRVTAAAAPRFIARARKEVGSDFAIWPRAAAPSAVDDLLPVTYLVPESPANQRAIGFDLGTDPVAATAIALARDRGEPSFSGAVTVDRDGDPARSGVFLLAPFYRGGRPDGIAARRAAFAGMVLIVLNAERMLQPLVEQDGAQGIALRVTDLEKETVIFDSRSGLDASPRGFAVQHKLTQGGRRWQLEFSATPELMDSINHRNSLLIGLAGTIGTLFLSGIVYHLATLRRRAEQRASEMTAELRASEKELVRHRDHLSELVDERTAELLAAKNAAEQAHRIKSEFLANMSHELRTPLHAILSFSQLGREKAAAPADDKLQRYFLRIGEAGERLLALVGDLLDLSKLEAGRMTVHPQALDLVALLREVATEFEALAEGRRQRWILPPAALQAPAAVDPVRFAQVVRNVLANAMKFSPDGGEIRVQVEPVEMALGRRAQDLASPVAAWRIAVIDEGVGIPEEELETVFDAFVQSSKTRTGAGGTGLGLAICREIVAAHRGRISAHNRAEGGAIFEILVPRDAAGFAGAEVPR